MKIEEIKQKYKNQWLLIKVEKTNKLNQPIDGQLVANSKNRDDIYKKMKSVKGHMYTVYSGKIPQKGFAVAFNDVAKL